MSRKAVKIKIAIRKAEYLKREAKRLQERKKSADFQKEMETGDIELMAKAMGVKL